MLNEGLHSFGGDVLLKSDYDGDELEVYMIDERNGKKFTIVRFSENKQKNKFNELWERFQGSFLQRHYPSTKDVNSVNLEIEKIEKIALDKENELETRYLAVFLIYFCYWLLGTKLTQLPSKFLLKLNSKDMKLDPVLISLLIRTFGREFAEESPEIKEILPFLEHLINFS